MKQVLIINGMAGVGKDTFVDCLKQHIPTLHISIVDKVKEIASKLGWDGTKEEKDRRFLSDLKVAIDNYNDANYKYIAEVVELFKKGELGNYELLCIDMREREQILRAKKDFDALTVLVKRNSVKNITSNIADAGVFSMSYDICIENNLGIEELNENARMFVQDLKEMKGKVKESANEPNMNDLLNQKANALFKEFEEFLDLFYKN